MTRFILSFILAFQVTVTFGQNNVKQTENWQETFFQSSDVVLPLLIDAAITYSAQIEIADAAKQIAIENQKLEKKRILSGISVGAGYTYGSVFNFVDPTSTVPVGGVNPFNLPAQPRYNITAQASMSLYTLLSRRHELQRQELQIKQTDANRKIVEREIRQTVINLYQGVVLARAEQEISQETYQTASLRFKLAEKQFANREIQIDAMSTVQESHARARIAQETAKIRYATSILSLEEVIGMKLADLMNTK